MRGEFWRLARVALAGLCLAAFGVSIAFAQGHGGGGPPPGGGSGGGGMGPGGGMNGGMGGGGVSGPGFPGGGNRPGGGVAPVPNSTSPASRSQEVPGHQPLQLGPPGRWWDDRSYIKSLKLRPDQQARMDAIFEQNRDTLYSRLQNLYQAESQMEELARAPQPAEAALDAQIDRVAQARADLEKANTHVLLLIRKEMDPDQLKRLENSR